MLPYAKLQDFINLFRPYEFKNTSSNIDNIASVQETIREVLHKKKYCCKIMYEQCKIGT